jgi:hypothetical protein
VPFSQPLLRLLTPEIMSVAYPEGCGVGLRLACLLLQMCLNMHRCSSGVREGAFAWVTACRRATTPTCRCLSLRTQVMPRKRCGALIVTFVKHNQSISERQLPRLRHRRSVLQWNAYRTRLNLQSYHLFQMRKLHIIRTGNSSCRPKQSYIEKK